MRYFYKSIRILCSQIIKLAQRNLNLKMLKFYAYYYIITCYAIPSEFWIFNLVKKIKRVW